MQADETGGSNKARAGVRSAQTQQIRAVRLRDWARAGVARRTSLARHGNEPHCMQSSGRQAMKLTTVGLQGIEYSIVIRRNVRDKSYKGFRSPAFALKWKRS